MTQQQKEEYEQQLEFIENEFKKAREEEYQQEIKKQARKLLSYRFDEDMQFIPVKQTRIMFSKSNKIARLLIATH